MKRAISLVFSALFATQALGAGLPDDVLEVGSSIGPYEAVEANLQDFLWVKRPIVVFSDTPADPRFKRQIELLEARAQTLVDRDVVVLVDTDPSTPSAIREKLRPRGFMLVLIGKDGGVKLRKPFAWDVRELSRAIDKIPLRRQELEEKRATQALELGK